MRVYSHAHIHTCSACLFWWSNTQILFLWFYSVTECLQGLLAWRKNYMEINDELYDGQYKNGEINEILAGRSLLFSPIHASVCWNYVHSCCFFCVSKHCFFILTAYDFRDSDMKHFDVHLWYNTTPTSSEKPPNEVPVGSTLNMVPSLNFFKIFCFLFKILIMHFQDWKWCSLSLIYC